MRRRGLFWILVVACVCLFQTKSAAGDQASKVSDAHSEREKSFAKYVEIPGAEKVGSDQCRSCHADAYKSFHRSAHALEKVECEDCHGPGSLHVGSSDYGHIIKLREKTAEAANGVCLGCHASHSDLQNWSSGAHQAHDVRCVDCHRAHVMEPKLESQHERTDSCSRCHRQQAAQASLPYHHPVREAKMGCADCHDPHGGTAANNLRADSMNQLCFQCHAELEGPFTYQHAPVAESCGKCHTAHGSVNRNLLLVSEPMLCLQCHAGHHNGTGVPLLNRCTNCHSAIHGTDTPSATGGSVFIDKP